MQHPLLVSNLTNIRYLSGVSLSFGMMIVAPHARKLFVDGRYTEKAKADAHGDVTVLPISDLDAVVKKHRNLCFEAEDVTVARLERWRKRFRGTTLLPSSGIIEEMRRIKRDDEIRAIRKACRITDEIMGAMAGWLQDPLRWGNRKGEAPVHRSLGEGGCFAPTCTPSERDIAWEIAHLAHDLGADSLSFDPIVAFGSNTSRPHHAPTERKLKRGDIVQIDMGVKVNGYCSDCSRVFLTGKPTREEQQVYDLLCRVVKECTKMATPGVTNHTLDAHARKMLGQYAQYFTHGLGHGVGLEIHEGASLSQKSELQRIKEQEVITIEPGIYFPGTWGMRIEDTILITKHGGKRLTKVGYF